MGAGDGAVKEFEVRRCSKCGKPMEKVDGSERTTRAKVFFELRCRCCGHRELDWHERKR
jgi:hypothetical protein